MRRSETDKSRAIRDEQRVRRCHERIRSPPGDRGKQLLEVVGTAELVRLEPDAQVGCPSLRLLEGRDAGWIVGVVDQRDARKLRIDLLEEFEPLAVFRIDERDSGNVAPRPWIARDQANV